MRRTLLAALPLALLVGGCRAGDRPVAGLWSGQARSEGAPVTRVLISGDARCLLLRHRTSELRIRIEGSAPPGTVAVRVSDVERGPRPITSETLAQGGGAFRHELRLSREQLGESSWVALAFDRPGLVIEALELVEDAKVPKLVVLGLDGLTWRVLDPLLAAGKLPHFQKLIAGGVAGELLSEKPVLSPVVWTTIAAGRRHTDHGIHDFFDAEGRLVNSSQVKTRRIWEIAGLGAGATVGVSGWFVSWPVERVPGFMLSDRATEWRPNDHERPLSFHPPELQAPFEAVVDERRARSIAECRRFTSLPLEPEWKSKLVPEDPLYKRHAFLDARLFRVFLRDSSFVEASLRLQAALRPDLLFLYLRGSDNVQHAFWFQRAPGESREPVDPEEVRLFGGVIDGYYAWLDEALGRLMGSAAPDTTFVIVSDHGFRSLVREKDGVKRQVAYHERQGVYVVNGPAFKRGVRAEPISVLDLAPLWLHLVGLPAAADMPGRVPLQLFARQAREATRIASYGGRGETAVSRATEADAGIVEQLKALGYVQE